MSRLTTLKPRLIALKEDRVAITNGGGWRSRGMSSNERGYGHKWQKARAAWLREHPLCVYCHEEGRTTAADLVDHIIPHRGDQRLFWSRSNWQSLCGPCHSGRKAREERAAGLR
ncbi:MULTISPECIES: HNH endonuclease [Cupriavidus]